MTSEEYGLEYKKGLIRTTHFLVNYTRLSSDTAEEIAQEAWVKGWEHLGQFRDESSVLTWVNRIAVRIYLSIIRKEPEFVEIKPNHVVVMPINFISIDIKRLLPELLDRLSDKIKEVFVARYVHGYTIMETALLFGISSGAVRSRSKRGLDSVTLLVQQKVR